MRPDPPRPKYPPIHTKPRSAQTAPAAEKIHTNVPLGQQFGKPGNKDWFFFSLEFRTMLHAGVPMIQALKLLETSSERRRVRSAAALLSSRLAAGTGLQTAVSGNRQLPVLAQALLIVGQQSGRLTSTLDLLVRHYQWMLEIRSLILRSIWYPAALVLLGAAIFVIRDTTISSLTSSMSTGDAAWRYLKLYFGPIFLGVAAAVVLTTGLKLERFRQAVDAFILTIPGIGGVSKKYAVGVFFEVLAATVESGMPITTGYELAADSAPNRAIGERLKRWTHFLQDGETLSNTLRQTGVLTPDAMGMVKSGEASAEAPFLMRRLADYYHDEIRLHTRMLISIYTPIMVPAVAVAYFISVSVFGWLAFILVLLFRLI